MAEYSYDVLKLIKKLNQKEFAMSVDELRKLLEISISSQESLINHVKILGERAEVQPTDLQLVLDYHKKYLKKLKEAVEQ